MAPVEPTAPETIDALKRHVVNLQEAVASHQLIGIATGLLAHRFDCPPEDAFRALVRLSQTTNVKLRAVARILVDVHSQRLDVCDAQVAASLEGLLSTHGWWCAPTVPGR